MTTAWTEIAEAVAFVQSYDLRGLLALSVCHTNLVRIRALTSWPFIAESARREILREAVAGLAAIETATERRA